MVNRLSTPQHTLHFDSLALPQGVADHGTPEWIVEAMLDLATAEAERIDSSFLEPSYGSGNFLVTTLADFTSALNAGNPLVREPTANVATEERNGKSDR